jgi:hypothetical protein
MEKPTTYSHRGVEYTFSASFIEDAKACQGIDILHMANNAIDRMLRLSGARVPIKTVKIENPEISENECIFRIIFERI